jgi:chromosome segregation ATPase
MKVKETKYLLPDQLIPHPLVKEFENTGVFPEDEELTGSLTNSIRETGQIQSVIVVESGSDNGRYYYITGARRIEACRHLGQTVRCEVIEVDPENYEKITRIYIEENARRRHLDWTQLAKAESMVREILKNYVSRMTAWRIEKYTSLVPELQKLVDEGVLKIRSNEAILAVFASMPEDVQKEIATSIVPKVEIQNIKEVPREIQQEMKQMAEDIAKKDRTIRNLEMLVESREKDILKEQEEKEILQREIENLRTKIKEIEKSAAGENRKLISDLVAKVELLEVEVKNREEAMETLRKQLVQAQSEAEREKMERRRVEYELMEKFRGLAEGATRDVRRLVNRIFQEFKERLENVEKTVVENISVLRTGGYTDHLRETLVHLYNDMEKNKRETDKKIENIQQIISDAVKSIDESVEAREY